MQIRATILTIVIGFFVTWCALVYLERTFADQRAKLLQTLEQRELRVSEKEQELFANAPKRNLENPIVSFMLQSKSRVVVQYRNGLMQSVLQRDLIGLFEPFSRYTNVDKKLDEPTPSVR